MNIFKKVENGPLKVSYKFIFDKIYMQRNEE